MKKSFWVIKDNWPFISNNLLHLLWLSFSQPVWIFNNLYAFNVLLPPPVTDLLLPENRRRLPLDEQLHYMQARLDEVNSGKHSIGQSRRAKALRKEISVIRRKLAHQREGSSIIGGRESAGERGPSLPHHSSSAGHHDEGGESSSQEIGGKGASRETYYKSDCVL